MIEVSSFSPLLPFIVALLLLLKNNNRQFKLLFLFILSTVAIEAAGQITVYLGTSNNIWLQHLYSPIEFSILAAIYYQSFKRKYFKRSILVSTCLFILFSIGNAVFGEGIMQMNSMVKMVENVLLISIAILYFYKVANDLSITYLDRDPVFLLSCALLIVKSGSTMSSIMFNAALAESYDAARICISIILVLNIFFNIALVFILKRLARN